MQTANQILQAMRKLGSNGMPLTRGYRSLYNEDLFLRAYAKIYRNAGALTPGVDDDTADGMSRERIQRIIDQLRLERFKFRPVRRVQIPKKQGGTRPLGMPNFSDKLVQEVLRMLLEAYYEPRFRNSSHGFRPQRGCHTALATLKQTFRGTVWFIEGDIRGCFDHIDHEVLMTLLAHDIQDGRLLNLIRQGLKAGVMEDWRYYMTHSGTPQGGILSPLLANIYLHELDRYVEDQLIPVYTRGKMRVPNLDYRHLTWAWQRAKQQGDEVTAKQLDHQRRQLPSYDPQDPSFRRLRYLRYADDFLLGFIGSKAEAEAIKAALRTFLSERLRLEMSDEKTLITHAKTQHAQFLGYAISIYQANHKLSPQSHTGFKRRSANGRIRLGLPYGLVDRLAKPYLKSGRTHSDVKLLAGSDAHIIDFYQQRFRGLADYYQYAVDRYRLGKLKYVMEQSLVKTLAEKFRCTQAHIYRRYHGTQTVNESRYKTLQVEVATKSGTRTIYWGAIPLRYDRSATRPLQDLQSFRDYYIYSDLIQRLQANTCELCGRQGRCEVHHVRKLSDLKTRWRGKAPPLWVKRMIALRRKTLIVCPQCHRDIHAGRPLPNPAGTVLESRVR